jgi:chromosome segregation ATPase
MSTLGLELDRLELRVRELERKMNAKPDEIIKLPATKQDKEFVEKLKTALAEPRLKTALQVENDFFDAVQALLGRRVVTYVIESMSNTEAVIKFRLASPSTDTPRAR